MRIVRNPLALAGGGSQRFWNVIIPLTIVLMFIFFGFFVIFKNLFDKINSSKQISLALKDDRILKLLNIAKEHKLSSLNIFCSKEEVICVAIDIELNKLFDNKVNKFATSLYLLDEYYNMVNEKTSIDQEKLVKQQAQKLLSEI